MLPFRLHFDSGVPAYRQVMDQVRTFVGAGLMREGDQVPSIRELARALAVNPGTIVKAYTELEHAGVIESRPGRGYFIAAGPARLSRAEREAAVREAARRLWLTASQVDLSAERTHQIVAEEQAAFPESTSVPTRS
jgi:GntR family transcriptional regulator